MNIREKSYEELELLSYTDIAYGLIKTDKKPKTTVELFKEICSLLKLNDREYAAKIADFFTSLTTDKRFILLNSSDWDLRENHSVKIVIPEDDDVEGSYDENEENEDSEKEEDTEDEVDDLDDLDDDLDEDDDMEIDDLDDLEIIDEPTEME